MYEKILIVLEGNYADKALVDHVKGLAVQFRAAVILMRIITVADDNDGTGMARQFQLETGSSGWRRRNKAETQLLQLASQLRGEGVDAETDLVIGTWPADDDIIYYAAANNCDLIVMASDSRSWLSRLINGDTASSVQRKATVPTLFISDGTRVAKTPPTPIRENEIMAMLGTPHL